MTKLLTVALSGCGKEKVTWFFFFAFSAFLYLANFPLQWYIIFLMKKIFINILCSYDCLILFKLGIKTLPRTVIEINT